MFRVDSHALAGLSIGEPRELHDRASCRVEDHLLDLFDVAVDAVALAAEERNLGDQVRHAAS